MKSPLIVFLLLFMVFLSQAQTVKKKHIRGTFSQVSGEPARTYQSTDGSYVSIPPLIYAQTVLKIKRGSKATLETQNSFSLKGPKQKGRWEIKGDTLLLSLNNRVEKYLIEPTHERVLYLKATNGRRGFTRKD